MPLRLKGQFQAEGESKKQYEVVQIHVANGSGENLLGAKIAQDLGLIQLVNKITMLPKQAPETQPPKASLQYITGQLSVTCQQHHLASPYTASRTPTVQHANFTRPRNSRNSAKIHLCF